MMHKINNIKIQQFIFNNEELTSTQKLFLLTLVWFRNNKTGACFPSVRTIAKASRLGERTAQRAISELKKKGILEVDNTAGRSNSYFIRIDATQAHTHATEAPKPISNHTLNEIECLMDFKEDYDEAVKTEGIWKRPEIEEEASA